MSPLKLPTGETESAARERLAAEADHLAEVYERRAAMLESAGDDLGSAYVKLADHYRRHASSLRGGK